MQDQILGDQASPGPTTVIVLNTARRVTVALAARVTGLTAKAINQKIDNGVWREGVEWHRNPDDGRRYVDLDGYNTWVKSGSGRKAA